MKVSDILLLFFVGHNNFLNTFFIIVILYIVKIYQGRYFFLDKIVVF